MSCHTTNCCDENPFAYRADGVEVIAANPCGERDPRCADPAWRATHLEECGDDPRCSDPVFAEQNPTLCLLTPRLLIKPASAVVEVLGSVQFRAFLWINGAEIELTEDVLYGVDDPSLALIGVVSGNATGLAVGITTVTATYGTLTAEAQLEIVADCGVRHNHFLFLFDVSRTTQNPFDTNYATLLDFAKYLGRDFIERSDLTKDDAAVMTFNTGTSVAQTFTHDKDALLAAVDNISGSTGNTSLSDALTDARVKFESESVPASGRVIVLFTDGRNNAGGDPMPVADLLRDEGTILLIVGLRAHHNAFRLIERMASGGFFLNAKPDNAGGIPDWLNGLRSYLCSGNCEPCGGVTVGVGQLNFDAWTNWDVTPGTTVDLIGQNGGGPELFDLLPGNGLYMDDHGSSAAYEGELTSKVAFPVVSGRQYKLSVSLAGHNRDDTTSRDTRVTFGSYVNVLVTRTQTAGFSTEEWTFTATADANINIVLAGQVTPGEHSYGNLIGLVKLEDLTTSAVLIDDNFDNENLTPIDVGCCYGGPIADYGYGYGYDCYGTGCLDEPIPGQTEDETVLPDLELGSDGLVSAFSSTRSYTASCSTGTGADVTMTRTATSTLSQADADTRALQAAQTAAEVALVCTRDSETGDLINYNATQSAHKTGAAAVGASGDYWNEHFFSQPLKTAAAVTTDTKMDTAFGGDPLGGFGWGFGAGLPDELMREWAQDDLFLYLILRRGNHPAYDGIPAGTYDLYLFGHGDGDAKNAKFTVDVGVFDHNGVASGTPTIAGSKTTLNGAGWATLPFVENTHYVKFTVTVADGEMIRIKVEKAAGIVWYWNGLQLNKVA